MARRHALMAEADHVGDQAADEIEAVITESKQWADEARRHLPPSAAAHVDFMASTMRACGAAALELDASSQQRSRAIEMSRLCSEAMVNFAKARARKAHRSRDALAATLDKERAQQQELARELAACGQLPVRLAQAEHMMEAHLLTYLPTYLLNPLTYLPTYLLTYGPIGAAGPGGAHDGGAGQSARQRHRGSPPSMRLVPSYHSIAAPRD